MPSHPRGSSKQVACGGDRFDVKELFVRGWNLTGRVMAGSLDLRERVEVVGH